MITRWARIIGALLRASLSTSMQYRSDFLVDGAAGLIKAGASLVPILLVFGHRDEVLGWGPWEASLVIGLFLFMQALLAGLVEPNLGEVVEAIRLGTLDLVLLKPADAQLLVSLRRVQPAAIWGVFAAGCVIGTSLYNLPPPSPLDVLLALVMLTSGLIAMYGLWILAICTSFYFVRVDNLRFLLWSVSDAGRWPLTVFGRPIQALLIVVIPVGVITTFPAMALRGTWSWPVIALGLATALGFTVVSRWAWHRSLASYTSASS